MVIDLYDRNLFYPEIKKPNSTAKSNRNDK